MKAQCIALGEAGVCGKEVADELISSDVTVPQYYGSPRVYKPGGVSVYSMLMRANKLETASVQRSWACLGPP